MPDGAQEYQPRPAEELEQLANLVRNAVGFDAQRGDKVDVVSMRFTDADVPVDAPPELLFGLEKNDLFRIGEYVALLLTAILVLLLVVKPIVSKAIEATPAGRGAVRVPTRLPASPASPLSPGPAAQAGAANGGGDNEVRQEEMIDIDRVDGRVKASSVKRVGEIVDKHPEETLAIVRGWLHSEA